LKDGEISGRDFDRDARAALGEQVSEPHRARIPADVDAMTLLALAHRGEEHAERDREMLLHVRDHDPLDGGPDRRLGDLRIETREDDDHASARIRELVVELADGVERRLVPW